MIFRPTHPIYLCLALVSAVPALTGLGASVRTGHEDSVISSDEPKKPVFLQDGKELRIFDIAELVRPLSRNAMPAIGFISDAERTEAALFPSVSGRVIDEDRLIDWLRGSVRPDSWEQEAVSIRSLAGKLLVTHEHAVLDEVAQQLEVLRLAVVPRLRLHFVAWKPQTGNFGGTQKVSLDAARKLLMRVKQRELGPLVVEAISNCRSGERVQLGITGSSSYQKDLSVEVAQDAHISDPKVEQLQVGRQVWCMPVVDPEGRGVIVAGVARMQGVDKIETRRLGGAGHTSVELARVKQAAGSFHVWFEGSGALRQRMGDVETLLIVERLDPPPKLESKQLLAALGLIYAKQLQGVELESGMTLGSKAMEVDGLMALLEDVTQIGEDEQGLMDSSGWLLMLQSSSEKLTLAKQVLRSFTDTMLEGYVVELRSEYASARDPGTWQSYDRLATTCLNDRVGLMRRGMQQDYVREAEVEIAQEAVACDPVVDTIFDGTKMAVSVRAAKSGLIVQVSLLDQAVLDMRRVVSPANKTHDLDCPNQSRALIERELLVSPGKPMLLGDGPRRRIAGEICRTRLTLLVRKL